MAGTIWHSMDERECEVPDWLLRRCYYLMPARRTPKGCAGARRYEYLRSLS